MTETITIDLNNVLHVLEQAVLTKGRGYKYRDENDTCLYGVLDPNEDTEVCPSCIVGHVIHMVRPRALRPAIIKGTNALDVFGFDADLGMTEDWLNEPRMFAFGHLGGIDGLGSFLPGMSVTAEAARVLLAAQARQDNDFPRYTWGEAYDFAAEVRELLIERAA